MGDDSVIAAILTASMCSKDKKMGYEGYMTAFRTFLHLVREELRKDREAWPRGGRRGASRSKGTHGRGPCATCRDPRHA